ADGCPHRKNTGSKKKARGKKENRKTGSKKIHPCSKKISAGETTRKEIRQKRGKNNGKKENHDTHRESRKLTSSQRGFSFNADADSPPSSSAPASPRDEHAGESVWPELTA
ncbi:MAG: hypothetical protein WA400_14385, partial [Silvibacterium sp.]